MLQQVTSNKTGNCKVTNVKQKWNIQADCRQEGPGSAVVTVTMASKKTKQASR